MAKLELGGNRLRVRNILGTRTFSKDDYEAFKDDVFYIKLIDHEGETAAKMNGLWESREIVIAWLRSHLRDAEYDEGGLPEILGRAEQGSWILPYSRVSFQKAFSHKRGRPWEKPSGCGDCTGENGHIL